MQLKLDSRSPVYRQVINYFKEQIASGVLEPGEEISSRRELANKLKINPNTVQRAYKEMEEMHLIYTDGNMPSRVTNDVTVISQTRTELINEALEAFVESAKLLHISLEELIPLIEKQYRKEGRQ